MRKLILQVQITIDGFAAGPNNEQDWAFIAGKGDPTALQQMADFGAEIAASADTVLLGRKTVQSGFINHWETVATTQPENPWNAFAKLITAHRKIVFSSTETSFSGQNVEVESGDLATVVQALKDQPGKNILVYGGVDLVSSLISLNLVDEYNLIVSPIAIGAGRPIFKERKVLNLESSRALSHGKIINKYLPV